MNTNPYQSPEGNLVHEDEEFGEIRFFSPAIRIGRLRYLAHQALAGLVFYAVATPVFLMFMTDGAPSGVAMAILVAAYIALVVVSFIIIIQRLHDLEKSGWMSLLFFVPLVNIFIAFYVLFWSGTPGSNNYGPRPPPNKLWHWLVGLTIPIIFIVGILAAIALPAYQGYVEKAQMELSIPDN